MTRLALSVVSGLILSFFSVSLFDKWITFNSALIMFQFDVFQSFSTLIGANFKFDIISFLANGPYTIPNFFQPAFLGSLLLGLLSGVIAKGFKRGFIASFLVIIISLLMWIVFAVFSGVDLMALFQGTQLIVTVGGILGSLLGGLIGGLIGGYISGPHKEQIY